MLTNLPQILRGHQHFLAQNERLVQDATATAGRHAEDHVQHYATFKRRTGKLQDKTKARTVRTANGRILRIANPMRYAAAIDTGSKPHRILPRRREFLRFRVRGKLVFARSVMHPGTRPYKFLYRATHSANRVLGDYLKRGMSDIARRF